MRTILRADGQLQVDDPMSGAGRLGAGRFVIARDMRAALSDGNFDAVGALLGREWDQRKQLSQKITTEIIEKAIGAARAAGAIAGKVCGAGGGGCIVFVCREGQKNSVEKALG